MNRTERGIAAYIGENRLKFLQKIKIGIAGAGGLGSNCAVNLVRSGFKRLTIVDFDFIEESNLNRQNFFISQLGEYKVEALAKNLLAINPDLELDLHIKKITKTNLKDFFSTCSTVIEALDEALLKKYFVESFLQTDKLVVTASGIGGIGNTNDLITKKIGRNLIMVGDMKTECSAEIPPQSPRVTIAAAKQADAVLDFWLDKFSEGEKK
jgi:sulfur carrier protein ThiS adenylyltransferase